MTVKAIRTQKVEIDVNKPDSVQWVTGDLQRLEYDNNQIVFVGDRDGKLHRRVDKVATELQQITDPITGETFNISIAGIGAAITVAFTRWMLEEYPGSTYDPVLGRVVLNDSGS